MCGRRHQLSKGTENRSKTEPVVVTGEHRRLDFGRRIFKFSDSASSEAVHSTQRKTTPRPGELPKPTAVPPESEVLNKPKA
jgi:hypothetical protein